MIQKKHKVLTVFDQFEKLERKPKRKAGSSYKNPFFKGQLLVLEMVIMVASVLTICELSN